MAGVESLFAGRYVLSGVLGSGGSGVVRRAHDTVLQRDVAIKLLRAGNGDLGDDQVLRARLRAEATLAGQLHHAGIAQVYDYGEASVDDAGGPGTPYIVMQFVEGTSLSQRLRERRVLPVAEVMDLVAQVADALQAAHAAGIVHRDLKPSNVLVTPEGRAVLVDFGIARTYDAEPLTSTGTLVGTADYVSPEQCAGRAATSRSDLYSLGMLAYECLTGHKPFHRESAVATALAHLSDEAPALTGVPSGVADLVAQLIRKDPDERPENAAEVSARAFALAGGVPDDPTARILPPPPPPSLREATEVPPWRREPLRSRRVQVAAAAVAVTVAVSVFVSARPAEVTVPDVDGQRWGQARTAIEDRSLEADRELVDRPGAARGTVIAQEPAAGSSLAEGGTVVVQVASGRVVLDPSEVQGMTYEDAARVLVGLGLVPVRQDVTRPGGDGTVVTALPAGRLQVGDMVTLSVGQPPEESADAVSQPTPSKARKPAKPAHAEKPKPPKKAKHGKAHGGPKPGKGHGRHKGHGKR